MHFFSIFLWESKTQVFQLIKNWDKRCSTYLINPYLTIVNKDSLVTQYGSEEVTHNVYVDLLKQNRQSLGLAQLI